MTDDTTPDAAPRMIGIPEHESMGVSAALHNRVVQDLTDRAVAAEKRATEAEADMEQIKGQRRQGFTEASAAQRQVSELLAEVAQLQGIVEQVREWHATLKSQRLYDELGDILAAPEKEAPVGSVVHPDSPQAAMDRADAAPHSKPDMLAATEIREEIDYGQAAKRYEAMRGPRVAASEKEGEQ